MSQGHPVFLALLEEIKQLHLKKSADYGDRKDVLQNLRGSLEVGIEPWRGAWLRALDKVHRINKFCREGNLVNESVEDSLKDLAAYCLLILCLRREKEALSAVGIEGSSGPKLRVAGPPRPAFDEKHE